MNRFCKLLCCLLLTFTTPAWAKEAPRGTVSLNLYGSPLHSALEILFTQFQTKYTIEPNVPNVPITLKVQEMPFEQALRTILRLGTVSYPELAGVPAARDVVTYTKVDDLYQIQSRRVTTGSPQPPPVDVRPASEKVPVRYLRSTEMVKHLASLSPVASIQDLPRENSVLVSGITVGINEVKRRMRLVDVPAKSLRITVGIRAPGLGKAPLSIRSTTHTFVGDEVMTDERGSQGSHAAYVKVRMQTHLQGTGELVVASDWDVSVPVPGGPRGPVRLVKRLSTTTRLRPGKETPVAMVDLASWGGKGALLLWIEGAWR